ncbi:MAG: FAD-dependent thymidylate synthase [Waddliaceae bacterium]
MFQENYEEFTESQRKILNRYVTNSSKNVFVLRNLPEVIKGALFSRYSRSSLGLRSLLLKEFVSGEESAFTDIVSESENSEEQTLAIQRAQNFYDRILDGYGDDSIGELGGAHLAIENISMIAAKVIEDSRIGGSPLEKSTRYIYFDQKVQGEYLFYREPVLMTSAYRDTYIETCNQLFDTYSELIPPLTEMIEEKMPQEPGTSQVAYKASLRAKVLDCLRGLLPAGTLTNMGIYGNGRFYDSLIHKLRCNNLAELQQIGDDIYEELSKVIPSFVRRANADHHTHKNYADFTQTMRMDRAVMAAQHTVFPERDMEKGVQLIHHDSDCVTKVAAALLYENSNKSLNDLYTYCEQLPEEEISLILDAACSARENRRHKSPRALEHATFTFELLSDFGIYRDLHRHRILTQERQLLSCDYDYYIPEEILGTELETKYRHAMDQAKQAYDVISVELPEEAQYIVPMAYNIRWYFHVNLRALQWMCELRSAPAGHPNYRYVAQRMAREVSNAYPQFERFFKFVDYEGYSLGRIGQEQRKAEKQEQLNSPF